MKKLMLNTNVIWILTVLLNTLSLESMQKIWHTTEWSTPEYEKERAEINNRECMKKAARQAKKYNQLNQLVVLPENILKSIFARCIMQGMDQVKTLKKNIKYFLALKTTCKDFNQLLTFEVIGNLCKSYAQKYKNRVLKRLMENMNDYNFEAKRSPALILVCAGANANPEFYGDPLLKTAAYQKDTQLAATLLTHHANPNMNIIGCGPVIFCVKTVKIAQLFIDNKVNLHAIDNDSGKNVLWKVLQDEYSYKLTALYLENNVDATTLKSDNSCILHAFASQSLSHYGERNIKKFLKKGQLLLDAMPNEMVNTLNKNKQTPIDVALESWEEVYDYRGPEALEKLIALFKKYGGKTAQELHEEIDINAIDAHGDTALIRAIKCKDIKRATQLLTLGANANIQDTLGSKALDYAFSNEMIQLLIPHTAQDTRPSCIICMRNHENMVTVPCTNTHDERMRLACYNSLLIQSDSCPLCRGALKK